MSFSWSFSLRWDWFKTQKVFRNVTNTSECFVSELPTVGLIAPLSLLSQKFIKISVFDYNFLSCTETCITNIPVHTNKNTSGSDKENVTVFVRGSWRGSWVKLSGVKVTEASDSLCRGGWWRWPVGGQGPREAAHFAQRDSDSNSSWTEQRVSCGGSRVSARPLNHYLTVVNSRKSWTFPCINRV